MVGSAVKLVRIGQLHYYHQPRELESADTDAMKATTLRKVLLIAAAIFLLALTRYWYNRYQQSDETQSAKFYARRADYETLLTMLRHDKNLRFINSGLTQPENADAVGISPQRIVEYRKLMSKLDCAAIILQSVC